ncbi:uncharacterized protein N7446_012914 [Penicillium canescens]|uniref:Alpha/beta hydrolase fold-3 domain-containing protein n=1 Tax=Penicillium canescens TaxID=5083 RepID=A0AAD6HY22_PENCN|nr:uncharacterized protein N7446_012914 [Penicillium canescens]KAJ6022564.1 hypothetical protein N7460_012959 [Penicillium canescens]KAJ6026175.1 hypothetical protein N7444_013854 [Penicillium canescens]KAJ6041848.1 hypothetical protein N7446_012914 [Penicillium canescens]
MEPFNLPTNTSVFDNFVVLTFIYKTIHDHEITTDVLYPKHLAENSSPSCPVILRYHGGGLVAGSSLYTPFFNPWYLELCHEHSAMIVSPNYRLIPESSVLEIFDDIEDHWRWMHHSLPTLLSVRAPTVHIDLSRIMTAGDSAGGYLSLHMGLSHPNEIKVVNAVYPMTGPDPTNPGGTGRSVFNIPLLPRDILERHMEQIKAREEEQQHPVVLSAETGPERLQLMFAICQWEQIGRLFPQNVDLPYLLKRLENGDRFPRGGVSVFHGRHDSVVPVQVSYDLTRKVQEVDPNLDFRLVVQDGEHGFDHQAKLHDKWLWEAVRDHIKCWLE